MKTDDQRMSPDNPATKAYAQFQAELLKDPAWAETYHDNLAGCAFDAGLSREASNELASRFMRLAFNVPTRPPHSRGRKLGRGIVHAFVLVAAFASGLEAPRPPDVFEDHPASYVAPEYFRGIMYRLQDGDTYDTELDLGFLTHKYVRIRLADVDTPENYNQWARERSGEWTREEVLLEAQRGAAALEFVEQLCAAGPIRVRTDFAQTLNRWVGAVECWYEERWVDLATAIVDGGHVARPRL